MKPERYYRVANKENCTVRVVRTTDARRAVRIAKRDGALTAHHAHPMTDAEYLAAVNDPPIHFTAALSAPSAPQRCEPLDAPTIAG